MTGLGRWVAAAALAGLAATAGAADEPEGTYLERGDKVPAFTTERLDGGTATVDFAGPEATVLVFFTSSCPHCHKMLPEWALANAKKSPRVRLIGVVMDQPPPGFLSMMKIPFAVLRPPDRAFRDVYKVRRVPLTVRVGSGGVVEDVAVGVIDPIRLGELMRPPR
jgi:hypothetical protein